MAIIDQQTEKTEYKVYTNASPLRLPRHGDRTPNKPQREAQPEGNLGHRRPDISTKTQTEYALPGELTAEITTFMVNHINALNNIQQEVNRLNRERPAGAVVVPNPLLREEHSHELEILNKFSSDGQVNIAELRKFLLTTEGKGAAIVLMEETAWRTLAYQKLAAETRQGSHAGRSNYLSTGLDEGILRKWTENHLTHLVEAGKITATTMASILIGIKVGALGGPLAGMLAGTAAGGIISIWRGLRPGVSLNLVDSDAVKNAIQSDPTGQVDEAEQVYWEHAYGINTNPTDLNRATFNPAKKQEELLDILYTRFKILHQVFGLPPGEIRALPDYLIEPGRTVGGRFFPDVRRGRFGYIMGETEDTPWRRDVYTEFNELLLRRPPGSPAAIPQDERIQLLFKAQRNVILRYTREANEKIMHERDVSTSVENRIATIDARLADLNVGGAEYNRRVQYLTNAQDALTKINAGEGADKKGLSSERQTLDSYDKALRGLETVRQQCQNVFGSTDLVEINRRIDGIPDQRLNELRDSLKNAEDEVAKNRQAGEDINRIFQQGIGVFNQLFAAGFTLEQLSGDQSFEQLYQRVVAAPIWPGASNIDVRISLMLAMSEARSRRINVNIAPDLNRDLDILLNANILNENEIWTITEPQLRQRINAAGPIPTIPGGGPINLNRVIEQAHSRLETRFGVLSQIIKEDKSNVTFHNSLVDQQLNLITGTVTQLQELSNQIRQNESTLTTMREVATISKILLDQDPAIYRSAISDLDRIRRISGNNDLELTALGGVSIADIFTRIHNAHAADPTVGWPAGADPTGRAYDSRDENVRLVLISKAEADARQANSAIFDDNSVPATNEILNQLNIPEDEVRKAASAKDLVLIIKSRGHPWDENNTGTIQYAQGALDQVKRRFDLRKRYFEAAISGNPGSEISFARLNDQYSRQERELVDRREAAQDLIPGLANPATLGDITTALALLQLQQVNLPKFEELNEVWEMVIGSDLLSFHTAFAALDTARRSTIAIVPGVLTLQQLDQEITTRASQMENWKMLRDKLVQAENEINENALIENANDTLSQLPTNFDLIATIDNDLPHARRVGLNLAALQTQDFEDVMRLINLAHARGLQLGINIGWSARHNTEHRFRMRLVHAMVEARARANPIFVQLSDEMQSAFGVGMSEHQFRTGTVASLIREINRVGGSGVFLPALGPATLAAAGLGAGDLDPTNPAHQTFITQLIAEANNRFNARRQTIINTITENEDQALVLGDMLETQGLNVDTMKASYNITKTLLTSLETLNINSQKINNQINKFTDRTLITDATTRAEYEQSELDTARMNVGVSNIYDLLFQYKSRTDRDEYFKQIVQAFPPKVLLRYLNEGFGFGLGMAGNPRRLNMDNFLDLLRLEYDQGRLDDLRLRKVFRGMLYNISRRVLD